MPEPGTTPHLWERMSHEPTKAYAAFVIYRSLGPSRTVRETYELRQGLEPGSKKSGGLPPYFNKWASRYCWSTRAAAYDEHMLNVVQQAEEVALSNSATMWAQRFNAQREQEWEYGQRLLEKVDEMLAFPITKTEQEIKEGGKVTKITVYPADWKASDITGFLKAASALGRLAVGADQKPGSDGGKPQIMKIGNMIVEF